MVSFVEIVFPKFFEIAPFLLKANELAELIFLIGMCLQTFFCQLGLLQNKTI